MTDLADADSLTDQDRQELEEDLERMREQRREYAYPGRLHVEGERDDRERIRQALDRGIERTERLLG